MNRKRRGLLRRSEQEQWLSRVGKDQGGFSLPESPSFSGEPECGSLNVKMSEQTMLKGRKRGEGAARISVFSVLFEGLLVVDVPELFVRALAAGIGHGKAMGLGLLSIAPPV